MIPKNDNEIIEQLICDITIDFNCFNQKQIDRYLEEDIQIMTDEEIIKLLIDDLF